MAEEGGGMTVSKLVVIIMALLLLVLIAVGAYNGWLVSGIQKMGSQMDKILIFFNQKGKTTEEGLCFEKSVNEKEFQGHLEICPSECKLTLDKKIGPSSKFKINTTGIYRFLENTDHTQSQGENSNTPEGKWEAITKTNSEEIKEEVETNENFEILKKILEDFSKEIDPETTEELPETCNSNEDCPIGYFCDDFEVKNPNYCQNTYFNIESSGGLTQYYPSLSNDIKKPFEKYPYHKWYLYINNKKQNSAYLDEFGRLWYSLGVVGHVTRENKIKLISEYESSLNLNQKEWIKNNKYLEECILEIRTTTFKEYIEKVNKNLQTQEDEIVCNKKYKCALDGEDCECFIALTEVKSGSTTKIVCYNNKCPKIISKSEDVKRCEKLEEKSILNKIFSKNDIYYIFVDNFKMKKNSESKPGTLIIKNGEKWYLKEKFSSSEEEIKSLKKGFWIFKRDIETINDVINEILKMSDNKYSVYHGTVTTNFIGEKQYLSYSFNPLNEQNKEEFYQYLVSNLTQNQDETERIKQLFQSYLSKQEKEIELFDYGDGRMMLSIDKKYGISKNKDKDVLEIDYPDLKMFEFKDGNWNEIDSGNKVYFTTVPVEIKKDMSTIIEYLNKVC
ncbi:MAG: hypothetical protein WC260_00245 [Candidatus Pacearchaeota archaeon]